MMRQMFPIELPWILGMDFSGTIEEVDANAQGFKKGDMVYGSSGMTKVRSSCALSLKTCLRKSREYVIL